MADAPRAHYLSAPSTHPEPTGGTPQYAPHGSPACGSSRFPPLALRLRRQAGPTTATHASPLGACLGPPNSPSGDAFRPQKLILSFATRILECAQSVETSWSNWRCSAWAIQKQRLTLAAG